MEDNTITVQAEHAEEAKERLENASIGFIMELPALGRDTCTFEFVDSMDLRDADQVLKGLVE